MKFFSRMRYRELVGHAIDRFRPSSLPSYKQDVYRAKEASVLFPPRLALIPFFKKKESNFFLRIRNISSAEFFFKFIYFCI